MFGRFNAFALALAACLGWATAAPAQAAPVSLEIFALENSSSGTGVDLDTGIDLVAGDRLVSFVDAGDCWSAGADPRVSNANGLNGLNAALCAPTADFGLHTQDGESFRYGALVGRIGSSDWFLLGTDFDGVVSQSGRLFLVYWDSNNVDNTGSVRARIDVNPVSLPGTLTLAVAGLGLLGLRRRANSVERADLA